ncbi:MAG: CRTAC1 family protein, partial [Calditrichaeota bacterium]
MFTKFSQSNGVGQRIQWKMPGCLIIAMVVLLLGQGNILAQTFTKVTTGPVVNDGGDSYGGSWGDYNGDGFQDLFVPNYRQNNFLYMNNGDGSFTKISTGDIVTDGGSSYAGTWGDYDNDGDLDLFVANFEGQNNFLYQNNGDGTFTRITHGAIVNDGGNSRDASWGDYDNDGFLDLVVVNGFDENNFLYRNNGDGTFTKISNSPIVLDGGNSVGCAWADYDNDGFLDLVITNGAPNQNNFLYRNNRDGTFSKITTDIVVTDGENSQGASWGDYDNDGDLDLFVTNANQNNSLYQNNGDGTFTKITNSIITTDGGNSACSVWEDFDNDGDLDLYVTNRSPEANFFYINNGDGTFTKNTTSIIVQDHIWSLGTACADYDRDGDIDIFVANWSNSDNFLFMNNGNTNNWLNCELVGTSFSNVSAIGSNISLKANIQGLSVWQLREVSGLTGNNAQSSLNTKFGLGDATIIDSIVVNWPGADTTTVLTNVPVNQFLTITEPLVPLLRSVFPDSGYQGYPVSVTIN